MKYKISRVLKAFKVSKTWVKALEAAAGEDYETARKLLNQVIGIHAKNPEYHLLRGLVNFRMQVFPVALSDVSKAIDLLKSSTRYTSEEKNYLCCCADKIISEIIKISPEHSSPIELTGDFTKLDKSKVRKGIRLNFPLAVSEL